MKRKRAVVLWTGGKDCNLALYETISRGYEIAALVSFTGKGIKFKAHPIEIIRAQANALGICHKLVEITEPYDIGYENAIRQIKHSYRIDTIVTGDIAEINGSTNWITERCQPCGVNVFLPLWHIDRENILLRLFSLGFEIIFSCVKEPWFTIDWLGKTLNENALLDLKELRSSTVLDFCGEQGEFHTLVLDGPLNRQRLKIKTFDKKIEGSTMYMDIVRFIKEQKDWPGPSISSCP